MLLIQFVTDDSPGGSFLDWWSTTKWSGSFWREYSPPITKRESSYIAGGKGWSLFASARDNSSTGTWITGLLLWSVKLKYGCAGRSVGWRQPVSLLICTLGGRGKNGTSTGPTWLLTRVRLTPRF